MTTSELLDRIADSTGQPPELAADRLDQFVTRLLRRLRAGRPVSIDGLGTVVPPRRSQRGHPDA